MSTDGREIGRRFLAELDTYLKENIGALECNDIHEIYSSFFKDLKAYKGNSNNFTGLSEYLILRSLIHSLSDVFGDFRHKRAPKGTGALFVSTVDTKLCIANGMRVDMGPKKRCYPDIGIRYGDSLVAVAQIKLYLTNGAAEVDKEAEKIKALRRRYGALKATLLVFKGPPRGGGQHGRLTRLREDEIDYLALKGESGKIKERLRSLLPEALLRTNPP